jgi:hypothetical protein
MTIQFTCPNCDNLIAFDSKHIGKRASCQSCGQVFIIPSSNFQKPEVVETKVEIPEPVPGFYRAVFVDSWKVFADGENATSLVFVVAAVCFKFFLARGVCCLNYITFIAVWGWLFGFYFNIISETALGNDKLPEITLGTGGMFFWNMVKPLFVFFITLFIVWMPLIILLAMLQNRGITFRNMWQIELGPRLLLQAFFLLGLFLFPAAILSMVVAADITLLRPDYLFAPIRRAFGPHLVVFTLLITAAVLESQTRQFTGAYPAATVAYLALNLGVQVVAIIAMRSVGLFYRHYGCYFLW